VRLNKTEAKSIYVFCSALELVARRTNNYRDTVLSYFSVDDIKRELNIIQGSMNFDLDLLAEDFESFYHIPIGCRILTEKEDKVFNLLFVGRVLESVITSIFENKDIGDLAGLIKEIGSQDLEKISKRYIEEDNQ